ncbi:unnamed protein product [Ectocarpus sp. 4 AP-2014]
MMATITNNNADSKSHAGVAPTAAPAPAPAPAPTSPGQPNTTEASTWPGALRIDVELAENHARRTTGADGGSKRHYGSGRVAIPTRPPTAKNGVHRVTNRADFADDDRGGDRDDDDERKEAGEAGAGLEVDAEIVESHHACRVGPVRHRSGITTRSASQRRKQQQQRQPQQRSILQRGGALVSTDKSCRDEALNSSFDDEVSSPSGETPGGGDSGKNNNNNTDGDGGGAAAAGKGQADKLETCHWYEREEKAEEGGDAGDAAAAAAAFSSGKIEPKADLVTHERVGVQEEGGEHNKVEDDGVQAQGGPPSSLGSRQPPSHAKGVSGGGEHPRHPSSMDRLARLVSRAIATIAKAETTTSAASEGVGLDLRCSGNAAAAAAVTWATSQPEAPYPDQNDPTAAAAAAAHSGIIGHPAQQQQGVQEIRLTFREAHSNYIHLRERSRHIEVRCSASIRTLQSVSQAARAPGRGLPQSYDAYLRAYYFFRAVERSVRAADVQEDAAKRELRRASQAARSALTKQARAEAALRAFDTTGGGSSSSSSSRSSSVNGVSEEMLPPPPPSEDSVPQEGGAGTAGGEREEQEESEAETATMPCTTRAGLELALGIARLEARRAFAEKHRAQAVANDALILVGALTAGDWSLAGEQYDAARTAFHDASRDALFKIQEFEDQTLLFKKLMQGRVEIQRQLVLAYEAREAAKVAAELAAEAMRTRLAAATAAAAETAMLREAAESGGSGSSSGGGGRVENGERGGGSALFFVPPDDDQEGWDQGQEIRLWPRKPVPSRPAEDQSGEEGDAGRAAGGATTGDDTDDGNEVPAKKKAKI